MRLQVFVGVLMIVVSLAAPSTAQPPGGPPPGGFAGPPPGGFAGPSPGGQVLSPWEAGELELTDKQQAALEKLQKDVDARLKKLLTSDQRAKLEALRTRGPGGPGPGGPPGGPPGEDEHADLTSAHGIMHRIGEGPGALHGQVGQAIEADAPDFEAIKPWTKEYLELAVALQKTSPKRGSADAWNAQTERFVQAASELDKAVQGSDKSGATAAHATLGQSCMACHQAHRPMRGPRGAPGGPAGAARPRKASN